MDVLKIKRKSARNAFTRVANKLEGELSKPEPNGLDVRIMFTQLTEKFNLLSNVQGEIMGCFESDLKLSETFEEDYGKEFEEAELYNDRFHELQVIVDNFFEIKKVTESLASARIVSSKNKLPKLELMKFDGDLKNWLAFWSQFKKIHGDPTMAAEDKFQYLLQSMVPKSKPERLIKGFPPSAENYPKAIDQLHNRYGRNDILIQVYVRELIGMVLANAVNGKIYRDLATLYDNLESHLRSLESLGKSKDQFSDFLCPLVESCLPKELLQVWERKRRDRLEVMVDGGSTLERLMDFLKEEVNDEERINLAQNNFGLQIEVKSSSIKGEETSKKKVESNIETAASLVSSNPSNSFKDPNDKTKRIKNCLFCAKSHDSNSCFEAKRMSLEDRKKIVLDKNACFICLRYGHSAKSCKIATRCVICSRKHATILCPDLVVSSRDTVPDAKTEVSATLCNQSLTHVLLGILLTKIETRNGDHMVRCMIDTGSQRSYIDENLANKFNIKPVRHEVMTHGLFGGTETKPIKHGVVRVHLCSKDNSYRCNFEVRTQRKICGSVGVLSAQETEQITQEFGISLTEDPLGTQEVELLIGADVAGKLFTGQVKPLGKDLVGMNTRLGWIVMGKLERNVEITEDSTRTTLSLYVKDAPIAKLWQMDLIGVTDPIEAKPEKERQLELLQHFMDSIEVNNDGRYQVRLPWKTSHPPLPDNKSLALQRLRSTKGNLEAKGLLQDYKTVFQEWLENGFIEKAYEETSSCHYLPHRPVIKEGSTTRIRPVFDASSHQKGMPSLNDCLEKGINLLEEIPTILDRFRDDKIGVVSDIGKAFLQLEVDPMQRDFLRFFGFDGEMYRHKRVVFGVTSSPFSLNAVLKFHFNRMEKDYGDVVNRLRKSFYVDNCAEYRRTYAV